MADCRIYDDPDMKNVLLKNETITSHSLWLPNSSPSFHGSPSMVNFEAIQGENTTNNPYCNEDYDDGFSHRPEKKRRLSPNQVHFLEESFEVENKLEPDRKVKLAKEVGLQPRQVAIWFQNRRARYKTKVLEKEYDSLRASYDKLKVDYDTLFGDNEKLKNEVHLLSEKLLLKENGNANQKTSVPIALSERIFVSNTASNIVPLITCKQEDTTSSIKSDVLDSDSSHYSDGYNSLLLEHETYGFSRDEDDSLRRTLLPKHEVECFDDLHPNSCNLGFPVQDQATWFWQC